MTRLVPSLVLALFVVAAAPPAMAEDAPKTRAEVILEDVEIAVDLARQGQYGRIARDDLATLAEAQATIERLLDGHDAPEELDNEERIALFNARQQITAIVGNDDKSRKICKRVAVTGSRVAAVECLTVAEREARARASRSMAGEAMRGFCMPGQRIGPGEQVSPCSNQ